MSHPTRKKIAILGGGVGAMVAAYELATSPGAEEKFDITIYQLGWRLGGKGASGRNAKCGQRIEEHGAHIWFGFYENAFNVMGRAYDALNRGPDDPLRSLFDKRHPAFTAQTDFTLEQMTAGGNWSDWAISLPTFDDGRPGDGKEPRDLWMLIKALLERLVEYLEWGLSEFADSDWARTMTTIAAFEPNRSQLLRALLRARALHPSPKRHARGGQSSLREHLQEFRDALREHLSAFRKDEAACRFWILFDLALTGVIGILKDDVLIRGLKELDGQDFADWMDSHGLSPDARWSAPMRLIYDVIFAYENGSPRRENASLAAGTGIRGCLRLLFAYKEAPYYEMQAGMGDTVFAPFYLALLPKPNVTFKFFHQVTRLSPSPDGRSVDRIDITRQVKLTADPPSADPAEPYDPLVPVKRLPCWPSVPRFEQIHDGDLLSRLVEDRGLDLENPFDPRWKDAWEEWQAAGNTEDIALRRGHEFDVVVLGISLGALADISGELSLNKKWREMLTIPTVTTLSFQLWLSKSSVELGWTGTFDRNKDAHPVVGAYEPPDSTWADFTHLVAVEDWPAQSEPREIAYFFGVVPDAGPGPETSARDYLRQHIEYLWPNAVGEDGFKLDWLIDLAGGSGEERFKAQWFRKNNHGSERYVLSTPDSIGLRLRAHKSGFDNLYLAGDWTKTGFDVGCVEAATMSGMQASRALCGHPKKIFGEKDILSLSALLKRWAFDALPRLMAWTRHRWLARG